MSNNFLNIKNTVILLVSSMLIASCSSGQKLATYEDDVYANPAKQKEIMLAAEKKEAEEQAALAKRREEQRKADELAKSQYKANPDSKYYDEPSYNKDDYYDNQYASRIRRFHNYTPGISYYDNYYTNSYWYDQNPYHYGVSIYNGYNFWGPSYYNYSYVPNYNWGGWYGSGFSIGFGNSCFNNFGYNNWNYYNDPFWGNGWNNPYNNFGWNNPYNGWGWNNPYSGWGYNNAYNQGFNNGYNQGFYNGLGYNNNHYQNSHDYGNVYQGPRHTSGSSVLASNQSANGSNIGSDNPRAQYIKGGKMENETSNPRFFNPKTYNDEVAQSTNPRGGSNSSSIGSETYSTPRNNGSNTSESAPSNNPRNNGGVKNENTIGNESAPIKNPRNNNAPVKNENAIDNETAPTKNPRNNNWNNNGGVKNENAVENDYAPSKTPRGQASEPVQSTPRNTPEPKKNNGFFNNIFNETPNNNSNNNNSYEKAAPSRNYESPKNNDTPRQSSSPRGNSNEGSSSSPRSPR
jgi:hypothetical protein